MFFVSDRRSPHDALVVMVDTSDPHMTYNADYVFGAPQVAIIDHHVQSNYEISKMIISIGRGNVSKKKKQLKKIRKYIEKWDSNKNLVIVSHFNVINPLFEKSLLSISSGEIVVSDKDFNILANWKVPY